MGSFRMRRRQISNKAQRWAVWQGKYADFTVITSDNPRYEEPERIMQTIEEGMKETKGQYQMMVDRKEAMRFMLAQGRPGDILIPAGKGHEQYQEIKGRLFAVQ